MHAHPSISRPTAGAAADALRCLIAASQKHTTAAPSDSVSLAIIMALRQQFEQSGIAPHLPAVLTGAAEDLAAQIASAGAVNANCSESLVRPTGAPTCADALLRLVSSLMGLYPQGADRLHAVVLPLAPATLQLARAGLPYINKQCSRWQLQVPLQQQQRGQAGSLERLISMMGSSLFVIVNITACIHSLPEGVSSGNVLGLDVVLQTPDLVPCLVLLTAVVMFAALGVRGGASAPWSAAWLAKWRKRRQHGRWLAPIYGAASHAHTCCCCTCWSLMCAQCSGAVATGVVVMGHAEC